MNWLTAPPGLAEAQVVARALESDPRVLAVAIFGSVARHEAGPRSDIDVLVVHDDVAPDDLADVVPDDVAMAFYSPARVAALPSRSPLFAVHLARESVVVCDPRSILGRVLTSVRPLDAQAVWRTGASTLRRLGELLCQPRGVYLDQHASAVELYALAKQGAMVLGAAEGTYEFNRDRALKAAYLHAALPAADRRRINALEEFWHAARGRDEIPPVPEDLEADAAAVHRLLTALAE